MNEIKAREQVRTAIILVNVTTPSTTMEFPLSTATAFLAAASTARGLVDPLDRVKERMVGLREGPVGLS